MKPQGVEKACPFCGTDDQIRIMSDGGVHWVACWWCNTDGPTSETEAEATNKWNTRRKPKPQQKAGAKV